jgi:hypothetical protein
MGLNAKSAEGSWGWSLLRLVYLLGFLMNLCFAVGIIAVSGGRPDVLLAAGNPTAVAAIATSAFGYLALSVFHRRAATAAKRRSVERGSLWLTATCLAIIIL